MADFRDFLIQFIEERTLTAEGTFTEDELVSWFKRAHPDRTPDNIHHQLLKKTTNYPGRVGYKPTARASDDLFFALDPMLKTFRLYRKDQDPQPYYLRAESAEDEKLIAELHRGSIKPNAIYLADCIKLLERVENGQATLVYLDPPFFSEDKDFPGRSDFESLDGYIEFIRAVVVQARRVLKSTGSLYFHSLPRTTGSIRPILDEVFGRKNFINEIIWPRRLGVPQESARAPSEHDSIFGYAKTESFIYNKQYRHSSKEAKPSMLVGNDTYGQFMRVDLTSSAIHPSKQFSWRGFTLPEGRSWRFSEERLEQLASDERIIFPGNGRLPLMKKYFNEPEEIGSIWNDLEPVAASGDFIYQTQEPVELLERIIRISTDPGNAVVDPFCGSGTTLVAAQKNQRQWVGGDSLDQAYSMSVSRLEKTFTLRAGVDFGVGDEALLQREFLPQFDLKTFDEDSRWQKSVGGKKTVETVATDPHASNELSEALRFAIENKFPYPIAKPFEQLRAFDDWRSEIPQLANIVGATIEYLAIIALSEYGALEQKEATLSERLSDDFKKPLSHGGWAGILRSVLTFMNKRHMEIAVSELLQGYFSTRGQNTSSIEERINELVQVRNELLKRSGERTPHRSEHIRLKRALVEMLRELSFLKDYPLVTNLHSSTEAGVKRHNCYLHMGARGTFEKLRVESNLDIEGNRVTLLNLAKGELIYLHPFYLSRECPQCSLVHLFRFDRLDGKRAEYIGPDGHNLRDESARADLMELFSPSSTAHKKVARYLSTELSSATTTITSPTRVGKYSIISPIRKGGMADVYKVRSPDDQLFALKLLPYQFFRDPTVLRRFRGEAAQARSLHHPNIVHVFDYGEELSEHYLVMELAPGWAREGIENALDVGDLPKPLGETTALSIIKQACEGLDFIHQNRIIHRDVKPGNLLLFEKGQVKLSDFGIARSVEAITLTMTGISVGTPEYSSPEQADGVHDLTFSSDIYSLGVVMFELLTGTSPFKRATSMSTLMAHLKDPVPDPRTFRKEIHKELAQIVIKCLQKEPKGRYRSAKALLEALDGYEQKVVSKPESQKGRSKRRKISEEVFYDTLGKIEPGTSVQLRLFLDQARTNGLSVERGDNSIKLKFIFDERVELNFGIFRTDGTFLNRRIAALTERIGHPLIGETYLARLASIIGDAYVAKADNKWVWTVKKIGNKHVTIANCLAVKEEWLAIIQETVDMLMKALRVG